MSTGINLQSSQLNITDRYSNETEMELGEAARKNEIQTLEWIRTKEKICYFAAFTFLMIGVTLLIVYTRKI